MSVLVGIIGLGDAVREGLIDDSVSTLLLSVCVSVTDGAVCIYMVSGGVSDDRELLRGIMT